MEVVATPHYPAISPEALALLSMPFLAILTLIARLLKGFHHLFEHHRVV